MLHYTCQDKARRKHSIMIQDVTADAWEWHKFWYEVDDNGEPYVPPVHCYSPLKCSTDIRDTQPQINDLRRSPHSTLDS